MASAKVTAIRKRQKIQDSNKAMFFWVAGMSVVVGFCLVVSWFLWQQIAFKNKVIDAKNDTVKTLRANNEAVPLLRDNIRVLETNRALNSAKAKNEDKALQVILDALPSEANSLALGASLQNSLADDISGLNIEVLSVSPSQEEMSEDASSLAASFVDESAVGGNAISFRMVVSSRNVNSLRDLLQRFEHSIRVIDISNLNLERSENSYTMTIDGHAYYEPARVIEMRKEVVKP